MTMAMTNTAQLPYNSSPAVASSTSESLDVQTAQCRALCDCFGRLPLIAAGTPTSGSVQIEQVLTNGQHIVAGWHKLVECRKCNIGASHMKLVFTAVDKQAALYEAAARLYLDEPQIQPRRNSDSPDGMNPPLTCTKSPAFLGTVALEDEENDILACQILGRSFVEFGQVLRDMLKMLRQSPGGAADAEDISRMQVKVHAHMQILLRYIGRIQKS